MNIQIRSIIFRRWLASELASVTDLLSIEIDNTYEKPIALACFPSSLVCLLALPIEVSGAVAVQGKR